jgi:hypothetical protein
MAEGLRTQLDAALFAASPLCLDDLAILFRESPNARVEKDFENDF